ncbi:hypothetical protein I3760_10G158400 [Carya illinoinensis]|nr:hypothetical protein I3760_10G158400 [Carya illinoinensis]
MRYPVDINGEQSFVFSEFEFLKEANDFCFALVLKFSWSRPSIDVIRLVVIKTWGLMDILTISFMNDRHILVHMKTERDYMARLVRVDRSMAVFFGFLGGQRILM